MNGWRAWHFCTSGEKARFEGSGTITLGGVSSTEELDIRTLQTKSRQLAERLNQRWPSRMSCGGTWRSWSVGRPPTMPLLIINPYCNQFDENTCIILKFFDLDQDPGDLLSERKALVVPEPEPDSDSNQEHKDEREVRRDTCLETVGKMDFSLERLEPAFSFLATLASSTSEEIESQLQEHVESSCCTVARVVTMYDKLQENVDVLSHKLNCGGMTKVADSSLALSGDTLTVGFTSSLSQQFEEMNAELEENKELAGNHLNELEELHQDLEEVITQEEKLKDHLYPNRTTSAIPGGLTLFSFQNPDQQGVRHMLN
ncbi:hypothetical protein HGM15179_015840 [Zosterops borbonicus]|uniref:E3 ubiquitin protein ligase n=1 Tax=Zosterops borbonicus TaxID=364589 RepID=A0A8K1LEV6_9PASS|nr:hypothetical protein HGM15179_015840 [Zosterops borbonicus]